ncbi:LTA synthase family protein [Lentimicrobium sp. L6]|uniref:LTA synthase family protein n=1 Tax=Lentimicrobium sp. L6 TaxID=2735916 RepID=UPI001557C5BA|nr:LTA synthase family protein [Lentimicrobium sp. L6]NPD83522.1 LTA synthase family protein [Lentimicrobium sp. L6]
MEKIQNIIYRNGIRLAILLFLLLLCRLAFMMANAWLYESTSVLQMGKIFFLGIKYDLFALFVINLPYFLLTIVFRNKTGKSKKLLNSLFILANLLNLIFIIIDIFYFPFSFQRLDLGFFQYLTTQKNIHILLYRFLNDYWYAAFGFLIIIWGIVKANSLIDKMELKRKLFIQNKWSIYLIIGLISILSISSFSVFPISVLKKSDAWKYANNPFEEAAISNTSFQLLTSMFQFEDSEFDAQVERVKHIPDSSAVFKKKNVVVFILESFTSEASLLLNPSLKNESETGYMPFLDSLMQQSLYFTNAYANGRRSIDAVPAILASFPAALNPILEADYQESLPKLLKDEGYVTQFFHGAHNGSMAFDEMCQHLEIDEYYGMDEYNQHQDFDGTWGIWDEPFLQFMLEQQSKTPKPFFSTVFNLSSHNPFVVPQEYENKSPEGGHPICRCISYSDYAISQYFSKARLTNWYHNTIFVFTADHSAIPWNSEYYTPQKTFSIPLFIFEPGTDLQARRTEVVQQIDIMPSILSHLNFPKSIETYGRNFFEAMKSDSVLTIINKIPQYIDGNHQVHYPKK